MTSDELTILHFLLIKFKDQEKAEHWLSSSIGTVLDAIEVHPMYKKLET